MKFHPNKCHVLHLECSNPQNPYNLNTDSGDRHRLDAVTSEKDIGITIDQQHKFSDHTENSVKKANRVLGYIARTFRHLHEDTFLILYKAMVRPRLESASGVWSHHLKKTKTSLSKFNEGPHPVGGYCHIKTVGVCRQSPMEHMEREREIKKFRATKRELLNIFI